MTAPLDESRLQVLHSAAQLVRRVSGEPSEPLLAAYYRDVESEELLARRPEDLIGAVAAHAQLAARRASGEALVRVFTPTVERDGWSTGHTVVDIVTDDMPYLVDSVIAQLAEAGRAVHLLVHPQFLVRRTAGGDLAAVVCADVTEVDSHPGTIAESWMHLQLDRESDPAAREGLAEDLRAVLAEVRAAHADGPAMRARARAVADDLRERGGEAGEAADLLDWLADGRFIFLGYRPAVAGAPGGRPTAGGLGLFRSPGPESLPGLDVAWPFSRADAGGRPALLVTKADRRSRVHEAVYLDDIRIASYDAEGRVTGEHRLVGLFTAAAHADSVLRTPYVAGKVRSVLAASGFAPDSHLWRDLVEVLEAYPRDELFQADVDSLAETALAVVHLGTRRQTRLFLRKEAYGRFVSCLVYLPRDRCNTTVRRRLEELLKRSFNAKSVTYTTRVTESAMAQLHFVVRVEPGQEIPEVNDNDLQGKAQDAVRTWAEDLGEAARAEFGDGASTVMESWGGVFPEAYKEDFSARDGAADLRFLDELEDGVSLNLYRSGDGTEGERRLKVYSRGKISLTTILPMFTHLGLEVTDERPYELKAAVGEAHIYDFGLQASSEEAWTRGTEGARRRFQEAFAAVWAGQAESDDFNSLVLTAGLEWRQVVILRAIGKYMRQAGTPFTQSYIENALNSNPEIAAMLVELFLTRFDPDRFGGQAGEDRAAAEAEIVGRITKALDDVASLDQDRIIRTYLGIIEASLRTNYFQEPRPADDGTVPDVKPTLAIKLDPKSVPGLPDPKPMFEIWVYSPRVEGVHLRFGKVARGGLRWSDRGQDFRTEVLGLVKAQMVKNAVIVPTGSKGGFFPKQLPDPAVDRDAWLAEGIASYKLFISSLLDLTDNLDAGEVVPPQRVVRHDPDDTYLVVAADKGTASFSDIANGVAQSYGFWLDDAFASGGSAGYDHKGMGITARGAWESVKRHFRELGLDTQTEDFTAVGIGDMSGDVFGNGMMLSEHIRLVAAFDHRHIFVDPTPDAAKSFPERVRLFNTPRSSWGDYDTALISEGGGVFPLSAKSITITPQMREALGIAEGVQTLTPNELKQAILLAPVDLLWNGGIGTYIKASTQTNAEIGDRGNDAIRVDGKDIRARVIGEGGNLGAHQLGRIEAAATGKRINTDAIDNSAGVDTSDHEVNIKILITALTKAGVMTLEERNQLLASMTEDVGRMVLRDNYEQNVLLGNARSQRASMINVHKRFIHWLEQRGELNRPLEFLPDDAEIERRRQAGLGLESPEFSVLVAYAKLALKADLLASSLPDDPFFEKTLADYFPPALRERYGAELKNHPLKREIVVNSIANNMINRGGITFVYRAIGDTNATPEQIAKAYVAAREIFGLADYVAEVETLDNVVSTETQTELYLEYRRLIDRAVRWFLQRRTGDLDIAAEIARFQAPVAELIQAQGLLKGSDAERFAARKAHMTEAGVPEALATRYAGLIEEYSGLDITELALELGEEPLKVAEVYFEASEQFGVDAMLGKVTQLPRDDRWDALARGAMRDDLYSVLETITRSIVTSTKAGEPGAARMQEWLTANADVVGRTSDALEGIRSIDGPGLAPLSVALRTMRSVTRG